MEMRCASMVSAYSSGSLSRMVGDVRKRLMMGWSLGLTLRKLGGVGMPGGSSECGEALEEDTDRHRQRAPQGCGDERPALAVARRDDRRRDVADERADADQRDDERRKQLRARFPA